VSGSSFACPWVDTSETLTLRAVMSESDGYEAGRATVSFTVTNKKALSIWYPSAGTTLKASTSYSVSWEARLADNQVTTAVTWERSGDGVNWTSISLAQGASIQTNASAGSLYLRATWDDGYGHSASAIHKYEVAK
jgi:hypothetical protein